MRVAPGRQPGLESAARRALLGVRRQPRPLLVLGAGVLRLLGQRHERPLEPQRAAGSSAWKACRRARSGPRAMTPRSALWPRLADTSAWWPSRFERRDRVEHPLGGAGLGRGPLPVDRVEEVEDPPPLRRRDCVHNRRGYPADPPDPVRRALVRELRAKRERTAAATARSRTRGRAHPGLPLVPWPASPSAPVRRRSAGVGEAWVGRGGRDRRGRLGGRRRRYGRWSRSGWSRRHRGGRGGRARRPGDAG